MSLRTMVHNYRRRRAFARVLRSYGIKPKRELVALGLAYIEKPVRKEVGPHDQTDRM